MLLISPKYATFKIDPRESDRSTFCRSGSSDAKIRVMAAEEGLGEDSFEVPALLQLVRRDPGPEVRPPGEAGSSKSSHLQDLARLYE